MEIVHRTVALSAQRKIQKLRESKLITTKTWRGKTGVCRQAPRWPRRDIQKRHIERVNQTDIGQRSRQTHTGRHTEKQEADTQTDIYSR